MPTKILIDANIYLRFYDQKSSGFKQLLDNINSIRGNLFISKQIADEVYRNKLDVAITSIKQVAESFKVKGAKFPEGFKEQEVMEWNREVEALSKNEEKIWVLGKKIIDMVAASKDTVSKTLDSLFASALVPTPEQKIKARERKEFGNPPGKKADPLGDQITWVQFLDSIALGDNIFVVSNDTDYFDTYRKDEIYMNPFLKRELLNIGIAHNNIYMFNKFSTALAKMKVVEPEITLPTEEQMKEIEMEESVPVTTTNEYSGSTVSSSMDWTNGLSPSRTEKISWYGSQSDLPPIQ